MKSPRVESEESRLRALLNTLPQLVSYVGADERYRFCNRAYEKWFGLTSDAIRGRTVREVLGEEAYEVLKSRIESALQGKAVTFETLVPYKDGGPRYIEARYLPHRDDPAGPVLGFFVLVADISDRVNARDQLEARARQQEALARMGQMALASDRLETFLERAVGTVCETLGTDFCLILQRLEPGRMKMRASVGWRVEPGAEYEETRTQAGYTLARGEPVVVKDLHTETRWSVLKEAIDQGAVSGLSVVIGGPKASWGVVSTHSKNERDFTPDDVHFLQTAGYVLSEAIRRETHVIELREAMDQIQRRLDDLAVIHETSDVSGRSRDLEEVYRTALSGLCRALGADRASILLFDPDGVMRFKAWDGLSDAYRRGTEGHSPWKRDAVNTAPAVIPDAAAADPGPLKDIILEEGIRALGFVPLISGGRLIGKFMIYYDTPHEFTEGELQVAAAMGRHVASAVERHRAERELLALNETLEQRVQDRTREAEKRSVQLRALALDLIETEERERRLLAQSLHDDLQQLLVATRMKVGQIQGKEGDWALQPVQDLLQEALSASRRITVDLSPPILFETGLVPALEWLDRHMRDKYGLELTIEADARILVPSERHRAFLFRAAREMLFNVLKHAGTRQVTLALERSGPDTVALIVRDEGRGFVPQDLGMTAAGAGFGLFSIRERAEALGGHLEVDSAPGKGTRLRLVIGTRDDGATGEKIPEADQAAAQAETGGDRRRVAGKIRVLLADDHKIVREGLAALLSAQDDIETVAQASDGAEAVTLAMRLRPDVVVMDVSMPMLSGIEATRRITAQAPFIKVIGLSMFESEEMSTSMRNAGASAYLSKDKASDDLCDLIRLQNARE